MVHCTEKCTKNFWKLTKMTDRDHESIAKKIADRLSKLKRYNAGTADDGGGYLYDYADESKTGRWVEWDDIQKIIEELSA